MQAKVYDIKSKRRKVSVEEYNEKLDYAEQLIQTLRPLRNDQVSLDTAVNILKELRFCGLLNDKAREQTITSLEALVDDMFIEIYVDNEDYANGKREKVQKDRNKRSTTDTQDGN